MTNQDLERLLELKDKGEEFLERFPVRKAEFEQLKEKLGKVLET